MNAVRRYAGIGLAAAFLLAACTPNGVGVSTSSGGGGGGQTVTIDVNLTLNLPVQTPYGQSGGMKPPVTTVHVGDSIVFNNSDGFAHTATAIPGATKFPAGSPFDQGATTQSGSTLSGGWSSGAMQAGSSSQTVKADKAGTYLFGCYFHYGAPMRGAIVVQ
ncbi:MAG TPA: plastocyanin/azurin family copper-binding protein [Candidatus Tumulicola sp.]|jgi:plastocyanin